MQFQMTSLHAACTSGNVPVPQALLEAGADAEAGVLVDVLLVATACKRGEGAATWATWVVRVLLGAAADMSHNAAASVPCCRAG